MRSALVTGFGLASLLLAPVLPARAADDQAAQLQALVQKCAPTIVTVRAVVKMDMKGGGSDRESEYKVDMQGVVVDPQGLILVSSLALSPETAMESMYGGEALGAGAMKSTPTSIKVTIGNEDKEYEAFLAATDKPLAISFIKIEDLAGRKLTPVDLSGSVSPAIGDQVVAVSRLKKGYDYVPYFQTGRIAAEIAKPRKAWLLDGSVSAMGLPIYTPSGQVIGVLSMVPSGMKDEAGGADTMAFSMIMRMFGGGGGPMLDTFLVPASALKPVIEMANQQAAKVAAERAAKKAAQPAKPAQPAPTKPAAPQTK
jgi:hypothetical protein